METESLPITAAQATLCDLLASADIRVGGGRSWDIRVHDERFFRRVLANGTLGFGEAYMDGWWDCDALDEMCCRAVHARMGERVPLNLRTVAGIASAVLLNPQSRQGSRVVGKVHYDLGNDFFEHMLDPMMQYSCAYFHGEHIGLAEAQRRKLEVICRKLGLREGMRVLDIGCGWGGLARHMAQQHGCEVTGVTISAEQAKYATEFCRGLPVEIRLQDYRELKGAYDRIVSVGMLEHVGEKNYRTYLETVARSLREGGIFLCQSIGYVLAGTRSDPWISRYIFPNSMLPTAAQVTKAAEGLLVLEDVENFGADYDRTLMVWEENFVHSWDGFRDRYGDRFYRMWRYYLLSCAGAFRARSLQLFQFVFSKGGVPGGCRVRP